MRLTPHSGAPDGPAYSPPDVDLLILDDTPQPLDKHIVPPAALAVHSDADAVSLQQFGNRQRRNWP